jgi:(p)ppGpp synthase/HD superfamily hydrolase
MSLLERAIAVAVNAHIGQVDKAGNPYILHPLRMMLRLDGESERIVAVLHDVLEDTSVTAADLRKEGFSEDILDALSHVTKREGEDFQEFVARAATNPIARRVKLADLEDNLDVRRLEAVTESDAKRLTKYLTAQRYLKSLPES